MSSRSKSRKKTPWDDQDDLTETQRFLRMHYVARYEQRHPNLKDSDETDMINSYVPRVCPYCGSEDFIRKGLDNIGVMRYKCFCGKYFSQRPERYLNQEKYQYANG